MAERAAGSAEATSARSEAGEAVPEGTDDLLRGLPDSCTLLTDEEASEILGAEARTPEGTQNEGLSGSLCRYVADRENRLGFELYILPLTVWDPGTGSLAELAALSERTRSTGPAVTTWEDGPGLGGYYAEQESATTAWIVTPYGFTPGMGDEASSQVYLRVYVTSPRSAEARLDALWAAAERILPRMEGS